MGCSYLRQVVRSEGEGVVSAEQLEADGALQLSPQFLQLERTDEVVLGTEHVNHLPEGTHPHCSIRTLPDQGTDRAIEERRIR